MPKKIKLKMPKKLGDIVDLLYATRLKRLELSQQADTFKSQEKEISDHLLKEFGKDELKGAKGRRASASITTKEVPTIEDFDKVWTYVKKHNAPELFQRRLAEKAVQERWDAGKPIPGIGKFGVVKVTPHKLGSKDLKKP